MKWNIRQIDALVKGYSRPYKHHTEDCLPVCKTVRAPQVKSRCTRRKPQEPNGSGPAFCSFVFFFSVWQIGIPFVRNMSGSMPPVCCLSLCILESCLGRSLEVRDIGINNLNRKNLNSRQLGFLLGFFSFLFFSLGLRCSLPLGVYLDQWFLDLDQRVFIYASGSSFLISGVVILRYVCLCFLSFTLQKLTLSS